MCEHRSRNADLFSVMVPCVCPPCAHFPPGSVAGSGSGAPFLLVFLLAMCWSACACTVHVCMCVPLHVCMCVQSASRYVMKLRPGLALPSSCQGRCSSLFKVYLCCGACYRCPLLSPGAPSAQSPPRPAPQAFTTRCPCPWLCTCAGQVSG